ncbi:MAG: hypothetical protein ABSE73_24795 [Planctomycetota bacterium]
MKEQFTSEEWQRIIYEHVKGGCCYRATICKLRNGCFPQFECVSTKEISDYLETPEGEAYFEACEAVHEEQIQAGVKDRAAREAEALHRMSVHELWEELTKRQLRRGIAGDQEATRFAIQLLRVGPRLRRPPEGQPADATAPQELRERRQPVHKDDDPPWSLRSASLPRAGGTPAVQLHSTPRPPPQMASGEVA